MSKLRGVYRGTALPIPKIIWSLRCYARNFMSLERPCHEVSAVASPLPYILLLFLSQQFAISGPLGISGPCRAEELWQELLARDARSTGGPDPVRRGART